MYIYIYVCVCICNPHLHQPWLPHHLFHILSANVLFIQSFVTILYMPLPPPRSCTCERHHMFCLISWNFGEGATGSVQHPRIHLLPAPPCSHETHQCSKGHCRPESKPQPLKQTLQTDLAQQRLSILQLMRNSQRRTRLKRMLREWPFPNFPNEEVTLSSY